MIRCMDKEKFAYASQKCAAKKRGIAWLFNFESWVAWWVKNLGPDWYDSRGRWRGYYVMSRFKDQGPYSPENIECILVEVHARRRAHWGTSLIGSKNGNTKLRIREVRSIIRSKKTIYWLASKYQISPATVSRIRSGKAWRHVTR